MSTRGIEKAWRDGEYLVIHEKKAVLPDRCVICNAPVDGKLTKLSIRNDAQTSDTSSQGSSQFVAILAPRATFRIGLCRKHIGQEMGRQRIFRFVMWAGFVGMISGTALLFLSGVLVLQNTGFSIVMFSMFAVYAAGFFGLVRSRPVKLANIDKPFVWIKDVSQEYLELFPELPQSQNT